MLRVPSESLQGPTLTDFWRLSTGSHAAVALGREVRSQRVKWHEAGFAQGSNWRLHLLCAAAGHVKVMQEHVQLGAPTGTSLHGRSTLSQLLLSFFV